MMKEYDNIERVYFASDKLSCAAEELLSSLEDLEDDINKSEQLKKLNIPNLHRYVKLACEYTEMIGYVLHEAE